MKQEINFTAGDELLSTAAGRPVMVNEVTTAPALFHKSAKVPRPHILDRRAARWARRAAY